MSALLPMSFYDQFLRLYVRDKANMMEASKLFDAWCARNKMTKQTVNMFYTANLVVGNIPDLLGPVAI